MYSCKMMLFDIAHHHMLLLGLPGHSEPIQVSTCHSDSANESAAHLDAIIKALAIHTKSSKDMYSNRSNDSTVNLEANKHCRFPMTTNRVIQQTNGLQHNMRRDALILNITLDSAKNKSYSTSLRRHPPCGSNPRPQG